MIGDSILAHAGETASAKGTPNLGLVDTVVDWDGHSSMRVQELHSILQFGMLQGNNIDNMIHWKIVNKIRSNAKYIFCNFPSSLLVWTDILPHFYWKNTDNTFRSLKLMDLKRKKVNRMIKGIVLEHSNGRVLVHGQIARQTPGFFDDGGVHLSTVGYHMYLFSLSEALSAFMRQVDLKVFNLE